MDKLIILRSTGEAMFHWLRGLSANPGSENMWWWLAWAVQSIQVWMQNVQIVSISVPCVTAPFRTMALSCVICEHWSIHSVVLWDTGAINNKKACSDINRHTSSLWKGTASLETLFLIKREFFKNKKIGQLCQETPIPNSMPWAPQDAKHLKVVIALLSSACLIAFLLLICHLDWNMSCWQT